MKAQILAALNKQVQHELTASYNYLGMSIYFERELFKGFAAYFRKQSEEERGHARRIISYLEDRTATVTLGPLEAPRTDFPSVLDAMKAARDAERANTASLHALYALAVQENDPATQIHVQWFIQEQVEEEKWAEEFVAMAEKVANHPGALFMFDHHVGKRTQA